MQTSKNKYYWLILFLISLITLIFCTYHVWYTQTETKNVKKEYETLAHLLQTTTEPDKNLKDKSEKVISLHKTDNNNKKAALKTMSIQNCDFAGWLSIPNTTIDYPVMQNQNNFYLSHDFYKHKSRHGVPFLDAACTNNNLDSNILIYGHHMKDGTMFAGLMKYEQKKYYNTHKKITFSTLDESATYKICAVCKIDANVDIDIFEYLSNQRHQKQFLKLKSIIEQKQLYSCNTKMNQSDKLLTLVTCEYSRKNSRLIIIAKQEESKSE